MPKGEFDERYRCTAKAKSTGNRCRSRAVPGANVCPKHGGNAKHVRAAGQRRRDEEEAERQLKALGVKPREIGYHDALLEELHRTAGYVTLLELIVDREGEDGLTQWGMTGRTPSVYWSMLEEQRKHFLATAAACVKANIDERRVELAEAQGKVLAEVVRQIVTGLGHDLQDERVAAVVRPALQLVRAA